MDDYIQFTSNLKDLNIDKKINLTSKTNDLEVLKFYQSIQTSINQKVSLLLENVVDVKRVEKESKDLFLLDQDSFLKEINSRNFKKKINEVLTDYEKNLKKALFHSCKVYLIEKYFSKKEIFPSFHKM